jgi:hypothetical protein
MSAVMTAIASGLIVAAVRRWLVSIQPSESNVQTMIAICVGLAFGLAPLVWSQALIAEVYALAVCFAALILYLLLADAPTWLIGFVWGIALGAHPLIVLYAPLIMWRAWQNHSQHAYRLTQVALCAFIGWDIVYGLLLPMRGNVPSPWGDVNSLDGWWAYVTAQIYHGYFLSAPLETLPQKAFTLFGEIIRQFTPIGTAIAFVGLIFLWRKRRALAFASLMTASAIGAFALVYNTVDSMVYLIFAMPMAALWLTIGLAQFGAWMRARWRLGSALMLLLPLVQLIFFWSEMDLRFDHTAMIWAERVFSAAPPRAILRTAEDKYTFTLWYAHDVLGERPDVVVVDRDLWGFDSYRKILTAELGMDLSLDNLARETQRPLFDVGANP